MLANPGDRLHRFFALALFAALVAVASASCSGSSNGGNEGEAQDSAQPADENTPAPAQPAGAPQNDGDANGAAAPPPTDASTPEQPDLSANEPEAVVERFMTALGEARFDEALALCDPNATGTHQLRSQVEGMNRARESVGEVMYNTTVSYITSSIAEVAWKVMSVEGDRAVVAYTGPREDHDEAEFEVRLIDGRWLIAPPREGMPIPKVRRSEQGRSAPPLR